MFGGESLGALERLGDLGLPADIESALRGMLAETSGAVVFAGPAGSGKTTTLNGCLRELAAMTAGSRSLASLEDPIGVGTLGGLAIACSIPPRVSLWKPACGL